MNAIKNFMLEQAEGQLFCLKYISKLFKNQKVKFPANFDKFQIKDSEQPILIRHELENLRSLKLYDKLDDKVPKAHKTLTAIPQNQ